MPRLMRKAAILAKIETTYGTDAVPTGADNAVLISNATFEVSYSNVSRDIIRPYLGGSEELAGTKYCTANFEVEISGSGTAGTAPAWGPLLRGCGMAEVVTAATRVDYTPVSTAFESLTINYSLDGVTHVILGARGTYEMAMGTGERPVFKFAFTGIDGGRSAIADPVQVLTAWKSPLVITTTNTASVTLGGTYAVGAITGGTAACSKGLNLNMGNEVKYIAMLGPCSGAEITNRAATGSLELDFDAAAEVAAYTAIEANTLTSLSMLHGTTAGAKVLVYAPAVQRTNPKYSEYEGRALISLDLGLNPLNGNDDLRIVAL